MSLDNLSKECGPGLPPTKNKLAINIMENGDYALEFIMNGQPRAVAHMKPAEAEQFAITILADLEKRRKKTKTQPSPNPKPNR